MDEVSQATRVDRALLRGNARVSLVPRARHRLREVHVQSREYPWYQAVRLPPDKLECRNIFTVRGSGHDTLHYPRHHVTSVCQSNHDMERMGSGTVQIRTCRTAVQFPARDCVHLLSL